MAPSAQPFLSFLWALYGFVHPTAYTDWKAPHETSHEYEVMSSPSCNSAACPAMDISFIWFIYPAYIPYNINHRNHIETMSKPKSPICIYVCVYIYTYPPQISECPQEACEFGISYHTHLQTNRIGCMAQKN